MVRRSESGRRSASSQEVLFWEIFAAASRFLQRRILGAILRSNAIQPILRVARHPGVDRTRKIPAYGASVCWWIMAKELWFSQTPTQLINWEFPFILSFRLGPVLRAVIAFASFRSRAALQFEILALRHQIGVLQRSVTRPKLTPADRVLWAWLCCIWKGWQSGAFIMKAATVVGWHRNGFGLFWTWKTRRGKLGRPAVPKEVRELIRMLSRENPLWGAPHIHGELLKLGIQVGETSVSKYMVRRRKPPSQTWRTFLENHLKTMVSVDFFTVPTIRFQILYVFLVVWSNYLNALKNRIFLGP